jgi:hypothetical protein
LLKNENATYVAESFLAFFLLKILTDYAKNNPKIGFPEKNTLVDEKWRKSQKWRKSEKWRKSQKWRKSEKWRS